jgi:cyclophilin family peptidyl-prolyl cis-trans isomerase
MGAPLVIRKIHGLILALCSLLAAPAHSDSPPVVRLKTNMGDIVLELYPDKAPRTVENFLQYVRSDFYDGAIFHRVIDGFMIQGGGFTQDFEKRPTRSPIKNEADNGLKNETGTIAMARTSDPHSATSQFFINVADNAFLDHTAHTPQGWGYTVFGKVIEGMEVVEKISHVDTGAAGPFTQDAPQSPVIIEQASVETGADKQAS